MRHKEWIVCVSGLLLGVVVAVLAFAIVVCCSNLFSNDCSMTDAATVAQHITMIIFAVFGATVAYSKWNESISNRHAGLLLRLVDKFRSRKYDEVIRALMTQVPKIDADEAKVSSEVSSYELLSFFSYICYLYYRGALAESEFNFFSGHINMLLRSSEIQKSIRFFHKEYGVHRENGPYKDLLNYGLKSKIIKEDILNIDDGRGIKGKVYNTHTEILNEVFNKDLLGHMSGTYKLSSDRIVWFPGFVETHDDECEIWENVLSKDGSEIREYWPNEEAYQKVRKVTDELRYVFGYIKGQVPRQYAFKGLFKKDSVHKDSGFVLYKKVGDLLNI